ncbi:hypothetical protein YC2023_068422 [Brassica napus]
MADRTCRQTQCVKRTRYTLNNPSVPIPWLHISNNQNVRTYRIQKKMYIMLVYHLRMANPERMKEEMIMTIDIPGKQEASPVCVDDSDSYCAEAVNAEESVIVVKKAMAA